METGRIKAFLESYKTFQQIMADTSENEIVLRDAKIQRFEYTVDAAWKAVKEVLRERFGLDVASPVTAFREAFRQNLIAENDDWIAMVKDRNLTSHVYSEEMARRIVASFPKYATLLGTLADDLKDHAS